MSVSLSLTRWRTSKYTFALAAFHGTILYSKQMFLSAKHRAFSSPAFMLEYLDVT